MHTGHMTTNESTYHDGIQVIDTPRLGAADLSTVHHCGADLDPMGRCTDFCDEDHPGLSGETYGNRSMLMDPNARRCLGCDKFVPSGRFTMHVIDECTWSPSTEEV